MMNEHEQQLEQVSISIEQAEDRLELAEALERLHQNKDFKKVILEEYFKKEAYRSVMLKSDANQQKPEEQANIDNVILGVGMLGQFFHKTFIFGEGADRALQEHKNTRQEILAEDLAESADALN